MRRLAVVLWLACACSASDVIDITYDPCSPLTIVASPGADAIELQSIEAAVSAWSLVLPTRIEIGNSSPGPESLPISFESGDTFYRAIYWDQLGQISISREGLDPEDYPVAIAHELGHAFGLFHVAREVRPSVMNEGNLDIAPTPDDGLAVRDLWRACGSE